MNTAIILAGGLGTRLRSVTKDVIPKPMVSVQGHPFLYWQLRYLRQEGIKKITLAVSHHGAVIRNYFGESFHDIPLTYSVEAKPLGTGGAIRQALDLSTESHFFILNGDTYFPISLQKMRAFHQAHNFDLTIAVKLLRSFDRYGAIAISKEKSIMNFQEKKWISEGYINGGIYFVAKRTLEQFTSGQAFSIEQELFENNSGKIHLGAYASKAKFIDIGIPEDYEKIQSFSLR